MNNFNELRDKAMPIATKVHKTQVDKGGKPYIGHPLRVEKLCQDDDSKIVALLHDTIEDGDITAEYLLTQGFPTYIVDAVLSVSRNKDEHYFDFIQRSKANPIGRKVKIADLKDNMDITRLNELTDNDIERLKKYHQAYKMLEEEEMSHIMGASSHANTSSKEEAEQTDSSQQEPEDPKSCCQKSCNQGK